mmetsp:Transcript_7702/g.27296  ORF Transcript_7702/g.27296 Transcript_7702/m.27296 type:complete len:257 (+) Transcript_7702:1258-2028(+)
MATREPPSTWRSRARSRFATALTFRRSCARSGSRSPSLQDRPTATPRRRGRWPSSTRRRFPTAAYVASNARRCASATFPVAARSRRSRSARMASSFPASRKAGARAARPPRATPTPSSTCCGRTRCRRTTRAAAFCASTASSRASQRTTTIHDSSATGAEPGAQRQKNSRASPKRNPKPLSPQAHAGRTRAHGQFQKQWTVHAPRSGWETCAEFARRCSLAAVGAERRACVANLRESAGRVFPRSHFAHWYNYCEA